MLEFFNLANFIVISPLREEEYSGFVCIKVMDSLLNFGFFGMFTNTLSWGIHSWQKLFESNKFKVGFDKNDNFIHIVVIVDLIPELTFKKLKSHVKILSCLLKIKFKILLLQISNFLCQCQRRVKDLSCNKTFPVLKIRIFEPIDFREIKLTEDDWLSVDSRL